MLRKFYRRVQFPGDVWKLNSELLPDGRRSFNFKAFLDSNYQRFAAYYCSSKFISFFVGNCSQSC